MSTYKKRALNRIAPATTDSPSTEEESTSNSNSDENGVNVANFWEGGDPP